MFFWKRFALAFNPVGGYTSLLKASAIGSFGVIAIMTAISGLFWYIAGSMILDKVVPYTENTIQKLPQFSVINGQLSMPAAPQPFVLEGADWILVIDTSNRTNISQLRSGRSGILITSDKIYVKAPGQTDYTPNTLKPINGMNNQNAASMLRKIAGRTLALLLLAGFWGVLVLRSLMTIILGGLMSVIPVNGVNRSFPQSCNIIAHATVPATVLEVIVIYATAASLAVENLTRQPGMPSFPVFMVVTVAVAFWAHFITRSQEDWA